MQPAVADDEPRTRIGERVMVLDAEQRRGVRHLPRDLDGVHAFDGMRERGAKRHAAPEPDDRDAPRAGMQQQGDVGEQLLRQHVSAVRRVDLPVDRERGDAGRPPDRHRRGRAVAVIEERAGRERRFEIRRLDVRCRLPVVSLRQERDGGDRGRGDGAGCQPEARHARREQHHPPAGDAGDRRRHERALQTQGGNQDETAHERTGDRARGIGGVDPGDVARRALEVRGARAQRERKRGTEADGERQQQPRTHHRLALEDRTEPDPRFRYRTRDAYRQARDLRQRRGGCRADEDHHERKAE